MEREDQHRCLPDELDLSESAETASMPTQRPSQVGLRDNDDAQRDKAFEPCCDASDAQCNDASKETGGETKSRAGLQTIVEDSEETKQARWLRALPFGRVVDRVRPALGPIWRFVQNPLGLVAMAVVGLFVVFAWYRPTPAQRTNPPPPPRPAVFPAVDFRAAERGAITERQAGALLTHYGRGSQAATPATTAPAETCDGKDAAVGSKPQVDRERAPGAAPSVGGVMLNRQHESASTSAQQPRPADSRHNDTAHGRRAGRRTTQVRRAQAVPAANTTRNDTREALPAYLFDLGDDDDDGEHAAREQELLKFSAGTRISAVLDLGISSVRHGTVVARTMQQVTDAAGLVIPKGSVLTGRSSSGHDRIYIEVTEVRVGVRQYRLRGVATRGNDLGLEAERIETPLEDRTSARVADGALGVLKGLATVAGGHAGRALSQTAGGAIDEVQRDQRIDRNVTLKVSAGTTFVLVITG